MNNQEIYVKGAREHNLKGVDLRIPKNKLVVFTGVSGSGKSSLAFDTIYAEGQRRYVESLSSYARQFLGVMGKPDVDLIEGLSPAISIDQKTTSHNPRSTVGTVTEIYDYMRLLFARIGHPHCPICGREIASQSLDQIVDGMVALITKMAKGEKFKKYMIISPIVRERKGEFTSLFDNLKAKGYRQVRLDGQIRDLSDDLVLIKTNKHSIDAVIDRISIETKSLKDEIYLQNIKTRLSSSIEQALQLSDGLAILSEIGDPGFDIPDKPKMMKDHLFSERFACPVDNISLPEIEPRSFSFNSPEGACTKCSGIGKILKVEPGLVFSDELTISEGGIHPYTSAFENETWQARLIKTVCDEHGISTKIPLRNIPEEQKAILMNGTGGREYHVEGTNRFGKWTSITEVWPGIASDLEKKYQETDSDSVKSGVERYMKEVVCPKCNGARLKDESLGVTVSGKNISEIAGKPIDEALVFFRNLGNGNTLTEREKQISELILKEIVTRISFLEAVGLDYLSLAREAGTLAGGEAQRIRLASQIGSGLTGVLYVLDEPTIGLHPRDNARLISTLKKLRDLGNTVVVVEHDKEMMEAADFIFDFGPGAGKLGGALVAQGDLDAIKKDKDSLTGKYLSGRRIIKTQSTLFDEISEAQGELVLRGAGQYNLKDIDVVFPLGKLVAVTGASGSGKSTLVVETLYEAIQQEQNSYYRGTPGLHKGVIGIENIEKAVLIDQSPIGRTPRSNPATYTKIFDDIRKVFALTKEARAAGYNPGRFSFNVKGGRCEACEGQGQIKIEMQFMADIWVTCEVCEGKRYNSQTLEVNYRGKNIADVLGLTVTDALAYFQNHPNIVRKLETLQAVGLDYMELGQPAPTLSGGEAQRVKLASELGKKHRGNTVYILDEPTTGLHFADLEKLLQVLRILVDKGNTVIVIEHNLDVIKNADWIIDLGPEGGHKGGYVIAEGTPKEISKNTKSYTGQFLAKALKD